MYQTKRIDSALGYLTRTESRLPTTATGSVMADSRFSISRFVSSLGKSLHTQRISCLRTGAVRYEIHL